MSSPALFFTVDRVYALHAEGLSERPGAAGVRSPEAVDAAVMGSHRDAWYAAPDGEEIDPFSVVCRAFEKLSRFHAFVDGNKRVAWLLLLEVLAVHLEVTIDATDDEATDFVFGVAAGEIDLVGIEEWLGAEGRLVPLFNRGGLWLPWIPAEE